MPKLMPASPHNQQNYFLIVFIISCVILTGFTYNIYRQAQQSERANNWLLHNYDVMRYLQRVRIFAVDVETGQRGYLLTRSKDFLEPYESGTKKMRQALDDLAQLVKDDAEQSARVKTIEAHLKLTLDSLEQQLQEFRQAARLTLTVADLERSRTRMDQVREDISSFATRQRELLERYQADYRRQQRQYYATLFVGAGLAIGGLVAANLLMMTITTRARQTAVALESARETYQLLLASLNDGIYDYRPLENKTIYSDSYAHMLGYQPQEIDQTVEGFNALLHPDDHDKTWAAVQRYIDKETPTYAAEFRLRHKDGSWRWIYSRGIGIWSKQGQLTRMVGVNTDISTQKQREEELRQLNADLEGFIYIASHDLRAPLVNLKGFAGEIEHAVDDIKTVLAARDLNLPAAESEQVKRLFETDIPESIGFIRAGVTRMDMLTSAILDLSRIGRREYQVQPVDAQAVATRCIDSLRFETNQNNIKITCEDLPTVISDMLALEHIFGNILDNAVKYMQPDRAGQITIRAQDLPWETIFSIQDNGRGILPQDRQKVFDVFRRASNSDNVRGQGMGLAFIKATLRKMGGRIWFDSRINEGTIFYFSIPKPAAAAGMHRDQL